MTEPGRRLRLEGLEPDNLLAFLALLGLLRALEAARPAWRPRAGWDVDNAPLRPVLTLTEPQAAIVVCNAAAEGAAALAQDYNFPRSSDGAAKAQIDLNYAAETARELLERAAKSQHRGCADLWS